MDSVASNSILDIRLDACTAYERPDKESTPTHSEFYCLRCMDCESGSCMLISSLHILKAQLKVEYPAQWKEGLNLNSMGAS
eukprot:scaffold856_cov326-Pavlova_lutheri.AAC.2